MDGNLKARIGTAAVGLPILAWLIGWSAQWLFSLVFFLLTVAALREYFAIIYPGDLWQQFWGIIFGSAVGLIVLVAPAPSAALWLSLFLIILLASTLWSDGAYAERLTRRGWMLLGGLYIGFFSAPAGIII